MWAALLGLMLVCSTRIFPAGMSAGGFRSAARAAAIQARSILTFKYPGGATCNLGDAFDRTDAGADGFGNLERSRAQRLGKRKDWDGKVAQFDFRRLFDDHIGQSCGGVAARKKLYDALG